jgi:hypothetical protein
MQLRLSGVFLSLRVAKAARAEMTNSQAPNLPAGRQVSNKPETQERKAPNSVVQSCPPLRLKSTAPCLGFGVFPFGFV